jgi:DNA-nicking Smr family endonuclease
VLPVLDVAKQIMIITGRGLHSYNGRPVLKEAIRDYFYSLNVRCEDVLTNNGALYVFSKF